MISDTRAGAGPPGTPPSFAASSASPSAPRIHRSRSVTRRTGGTAPRCRGGLLEQKAVHRLPLAGGKVPVKRPVPQTLVPLGRGKVLPLGQPLPHRMALFGGELPKVSHELLDGPLLLRPAGWAAPPPSLLQGGYLVPSPGYGSFPVVRNGQSPGNGHDGQTDRPCTRQNPPFSVTPVHQSTPVAGTAG